MNIGIFLPNQIRDVDAAVIPRYAVRAEQAGFSRLATVGRVAYPGVLDTVALAAAAAVTSTIELFSSVLLATVWPPVLLAKEIADIDRLSGGRLTVGLGLGARADDFVVEGRGFQRLGARIDADLQTFDSVWAGAPIGGGVNAAVPEGSRRVPMYLGGTSAASFRRMAQWGQGYVGPALPPAALDDTFSAARTAWVDAGRNGELPIVAVTYFAFDDGDEVRTNVAEYYSSTPDFQRLIVDGIPIGAPALRQRIKEFEAWGVDTLLLCPGTADLDNVERAAHLAL